MTGRERVYTAMSRQVPDRVPCEAGMTSALFERFKAETGIENPAEHWHFDTAGVGLKPSQVKRDFTPYHPEGIPEDAGVGDYGTVELKGSFYHFTKKQYPLDQPTTLRDLEEYPWPDPTPAYRHEHLEAAVAALHEQGKYVIGFVGHIWENAWQITSMPKLMLQFLEEPEQAEYLLDRITENNLFVAKRFAEAGVDCVQTGDDVGMQDRLMMKPAEWRRFLKPRLARVIAAARAVRPEIPVWYHSDGKIVDIIDDLIEVGVTVLNPVQPECLDLRWLKERYGDRLAFWGTIGTQTVMPFGTPADVRQTVREMIDLFWPGIVIAPTHVLEPDVPWENILAFFQAVEEFGARG